MLSADIKFKVKEAILTSLFKQYKTQEYSRIAQYITNVLNLCYTSSEVYHLLPKEVHHCIKFSFKEPPHTSVLQRPDVMSFMKDKKNQETLVLIKEQLTRNILLGN